MNTLLMIARGSIVLGGAFLLLAFLAHPVFLFLILIAYLKGMFNFSNIGKAAGHIVRWVVSSEEPNKINTGNTKEA